MVPPPISAPLKARLVAECVKLGNSFAREVFEQTRAGQTITLTEAELAAILAVVAERVAEQSAAAMGAAVETVFGQKRSVQ